MNKPKVICICGSTKFKDEYLKAQIDITMNGEIFLTVGFFGHSGDSFAFKPETKAMIDKLHFRKIDLSDEIFVINVNGYIGESTRNEIEYAQKQGKTVKYLEPPKNQQI